MVSVGAREAGSLAWPPRAQSRSVAVVALDCGFARNIELLSGLRRTVTEGHELPASPRYLDSVQDLLETGTILLAQTDAVAIVATASRPLGR